ncbi:helix-turn-helix transcriptional regulator [Streptomyces sp. ISL-43]|uniref:helix-turn-helix domain-containing protein n=1 Tax=Streptomyces sp. ISL-43 TaxID=2819183 RepID=UPI001BE7F448|nr:helix-turn-helix transcriptional regulator [Streptomyces sp. ISL-43]MBT2451280.1 helix-turn-helix transcriptional regulator [Streptomyces sp. ISL-43]
MSTDFQRAREALGARLRELRTEAHLTHRELAARLGWAHSKISKLETGKQTASIADLAAWAESTGFSDTLPELKNHLRRLETHYRSWRRQLAGGHKAVQDAALAEEQRAQVIRVYETSVVPGIFQTADYARHLFTHSARLRRSPRDVEDAVRARMRRQEVLYQRGQKYRVIIWEATLYAVIGSPEVMLGQLDRLAGIIGLDTVTLGVLPFSASLDLTPKHGFWIHDDRNVIVETLSAEMELKEPDDVALYLRLWDYYDSAAVYGHTAHRAIARARHALGS